MTFRQYLIKEGLAQINNLSAQQVERPRRIQDNSDEIPYPPPVQGIGPSLPDMLVVIHMTSIA